MEKQEVFDEGLELEVDEYLYPSGIKELFGSCWQAQHVVRILWTSLLSILTAKLLIASVSSTSVISVTSLPGLAQRMSSFK